MENKNKSEQRFKILLKKFQEGECSPLELNEFHILIDEEPSASEIKSTMFQELDRQEYTEVAAFNGNKLFLNLKSHLEKKIQEPKLYRFSLFYRAVSVAAILLLFFAGGLTFYLVNEKTTIQNLLSVSYNEVVAPLEAKSQVILPDSSVVWLNAGSKLKYSSNFNINNRLVSLEGEAYFHVAKNNKHDFVVDVSGFMIEGDEAEFNVKAYVDEPTIEAILVNGKVWINHRTERIASNVSLDRKFKATFYKQSEILALNPTQPRLVISPNVDPKPLISWKDGLITDQNSNTMDHFRTYCGQDLVMNKVLKNRKSEFEYRFNEPNIK